MKRMYLIPVKDKCNANCTFCYMHEKEKDELKPRFIDLSKLENIVSELGGGVKEVEITGGGEPLLHPKIEDIVSLFQKENIYTKIYTNGFLLKPIKKIDEMNISRVHWDSEINNKFYRSKSHNELRDVLEYYRKPADKIRMQTILLKGAIDSKEKIEEFVSKYEDIVDVFMFRKLFDSCKREKDRFVEYPDLNHPKVVFDKTLDNYNRDLYFVDTAGNVSEEFDYG